MSAATNQLVTRGYRALARRDAVVRSALRARNIATAMLGHRLAPAGIDAERNGEAWFARCVGEVTTAFVDVGANVGDWSAVMLASAPGARAVLYEPSEQAQVRLQARFAANDRVSIMPAAVADTAGQMPFFEEEGVGETSSLVASHSAAGAAARTVAVVTIDEELDRLGIEQLSVLKVDAEGFDLHVLRGAAKTLEQGRIGAVQFEYNAPWAAVGSTLAGAYDLLERHGLRTYLLRPEGLFSYDLGRFGELFTYSNFVALGPSMQERFADKLRGPLL